MLIQPYNLEELHFAFEYRVYLRWQTFRHRSQPPLAQLNKETIAQITDEFNIRVLESKSSQTDVLLLVSLRPAETVSACASKVKGQISRWLRERLALSDPTKLLSRGYFACTTGTSTADAVQRYLDKQGERHGYSGRARPPLLVREFEISDADWSRLQPKHARTHLQFHVVLSTWYRKGIFGTPQAKAVTSGWRALENEQKFALRKVSFVPDHVHLALQTHPTVPPASLIVRLMNASQELLFKEFSGDVIRAAVNRLWQPSAYLGSFGNLASPQIQTYIRDWQSKG